MDIKTQEAVDYFKSNKGYKRLFEGLIEKYRNSGKFGGTLFIFNLMPEEKQALSSLFNYDYSSRSGAKITLTDFQKALDQSMFAGIDIIKLLEGYSGNIIITNTKKEQLYLKEKKRFFQEIQAKYNDEYCKLWLEHIQEKGFGTKGIHYNYDKNKNSLKEHLENTLTAITELRKIMQFGSRNNSFIRLSVFAKMITKTTYGFDKDVEQGKIFISALQWIRKYENKEFQYITNPVIDELTEIYYYFGLLRDDLLNLVTCAGIVGFYRNQEMPASMWQSAWEDENVLNISLRELVKINRSIPALTYFNKSFPNVVFVVENSEVFSAILDQFKNSYLPPLICTHEQFKLATLILIDLLVDNGTTIYYSGDFDAEGLQMAEKLKQRHPNSVKLWRYNVEDYEKSISNIDESRSELKPFKRITTEELLLVKKQILIKQKAGYQEDIIDYLVKDIKEIYKSDIVK